MASGNTPNDINQASYSPTPWEDQRWEIVGEFKGDERFLPAEFEVLEASAPVADPMFADYGGLPPVSEKRWHLPVELSTGNNSFKKEREEEEENDPRIKIHPDDLEKKIAAARDEGRVEALTAAISHQQENLERLQRQINTVLADMDAQMKERAVLLEQQALGLALDISKKLIDDAVEINPEYILPVISEAIAKVGTATVRSVRVSPEDMEFINIIGIEKQLKEFDGTWTFHADGTIKSGCVVDTSAGEVDFQLDAAWERMREKIYSGK